MSSNDEDPVDNKDLLMFFPEGALALIAVITAPVWAVILVLAGHILAGVAWLVGSWSLGYLAYWSYRKGERGGIFAAIFGLCILATAVDKWSHK
jgi:hypothetical protein